MVIIIVLLLEIDEHFMKYYFNKNRNDTNTDYILTYCYTRYIIYMLGFLIIMFGDTHCDRNIMIGSSIFHKEFSS